MSNTKVCFKCGKEKPLNDFYRHMRMSDGHLNKCKECTKKDVSGNYHDKRGYYAEYEKKRNQDCERRKSKGNHQRARRKARPDVYSCMTKVSNAVRDKRLYKKSCEICGCDKAEAHHDDYSKPLDVRWLCRAHHLEHHGKQAYSELIFETESGSAATVEQMLFMDSISDNQLKIRRNYV